VIPERKHILLTGATGYVGGRLLAASHQRGYRVRALARRPEFLHTDPAWEIEKARGDVLDKSTLLSALKDIDAAFYLIHSMATEGDFVELDRRGARVRRWTNHLSWWTWVGQFTVAPPPEPTGSG
jgi:uncharacterized protein YbjT (DUF2867 family)